MCVCVCVCVCVSVYLYLLVQDCQRPSFVVAWCSPIWCSLIISHGGDLNSCAVDKLSMNNRYIFMEQKLIYLRTFTSIVKHAVCFRNI